MNPCTPLPSRFDAFAGQRQRWAREEEEAARAKAHNHFLQTWHATRFKVGDVVLHEGRQRVRIVEVFPPGYISVPSKYNMLGRWAPAVTCDKTLYRFRPEAQPTGASGQTSEDRLQALPEGSRP